MTSKHLGLPPTENHTNVSPRSYVEFLLQKRHDVNAIFALERENVARDVTQAACRFHFGEAHYVYVHRLRYNPKS